MADIVSDHFERDIGLNQVLHAGMAEGVRAGARDLNTRGVQVHLRAGRDAVTAERCERALGNEKEAPLLNLGTGEAKIVDDGLADGRRERVDRRVPSLALGDMQLFLLPIEVLQAQHGDLPCTQSIADQ